MLCLTRPKYFAPIHGQYAMQKRHIDLAIETGVKKENCFILSNGDVLIINKNGVQLSNKVKSGDIFIDHNNSIIDNNIIRERKSLSEEGMVSCIFVLKNNKLIKNPEILTRGFIYVNKSEVLINKIQEKSILAFKEYSSTHKKINTTVLKKHISNYLSTFIYELTERKPIIIPVIMDITNK